MTEEERYVLYVEYWNYHLDFIKQDIEFHDNDQDYYFKWDQLVRQEIIMFINIGDQVDIETIDWLSDRRGFSIVQRQFLIDITKYVELGDNLP